ncbi:acyltransferase [Dechloromonas sp.]|uniref:acyltransferase family protein n=1 Tax=Dechloromonas sp. TaxID=1917218 RepID=UPI00121E7D61|nr:acyltransferase [Dechloromonas sp.]MBU3696103.1 acyltransferase [Dechloromonas sp.]TEX47762.1 MAG: GTP cyclohydrolase [Rhodocyclaceae bacterium]
MTTASQRMPLIDALKAIASQLIVLHHLASYGPLAAAGRDLLPGTMGWLFEYARMAVQVFLVIGGFLAIRGLSPNGEALAGSPLPLLWKRYLRLSIPFLAAIALAIIGSAIADHWLDDEAIPARATFGQWLAHATLLHGILGVDSLSAGVWYIAIDFQLFALTALLLWAGRRRLLAPALILATGIASLFWFNRDAGWDNWAVYFFGSYALGAAAWWAGDRRQYLVWLSLILTVGVAVLLVDFRLRIALALGVALLLGCSRRTGWLERCPEIAPLPWLGRISYSVFLIHFPILLLANAVVAQFDTLSDTATIAAMLLAWIASIAAGALFYRFVESPSASQRISGAIGKLMLGPLSLAAKLPGAALLMARLRRA